MNLNAILASSAALLALSGCGNEPSSKAPTQVAARVNTDEVTVHQVSYVLARSGGIAAESAPKAKRDALEGLITQQLAIQQAVEAGLDRSPKVLQDMEAARREILARAYRDRVVADLPAPEPRELDEYYAANPSLFAERRLFHIEEIAFAADAKMAASVRNVLRDASSLKQVGDWLRARSVRFAANQGVRGAEHISLDILPRMQAMKPGDMSLVEAGEGRYQAIRVVAVQPAPVDKATAAPRIRQFLFNQRARKALAEELQRLRGQAKIEYLGEFASSGAESAAPAKPKAEAKSGDFRYSWDEEAKPQSVAPAGQPGKQ